ncbi:MAG: hypothetical protein AAGA12_11825 [Pseudomonadota bacterium]
MIEGLIAKRKTHSYFAKERAALFIKAVKFLGLAVAVVWALAFAIAWTSPVSYLKVQSRMGIAPISVLWALDRANKDLVSGAYEACDQPVLFAWYGSFGGGPVLPDEKTVPATAEFDEVVLFRSGIVRERTQTALDKMAVFNDITHSRCFTEAES